MKPKRWVIRKRDSDVTKVLIMARRRIKDPKHWCTGVFARDLRGNMVHTHHAMARKWCAVGSIYASAGGDSRLATLTSHALQDARGTVPSLYDINDALGHDAVMALYDQAIEHSRQ